jgi:pSer/pThr/pTyr-binding forkhead associated (FHA) protein
VARKHLGIRRDQSGYELADLGSVNGVTVNGQRMARRSLVSGDIIRIGASEMVFRMDKVG